MIIKDINVNNFGKLSDIRLTPSDGLNVIYAPNESGKTTLMSFVKYILYGTKQKKQSGDLSFKERYTPWSGLPIGGSIEVDYKNSTYVIQRIEQNNGSKLSVFNMSAGEKEDNIRSPGIYFTGMGEKAYSDSAYISDIHSIRSSAGDGELLSGLLDSSTNKNVYIRIKKELNERYMQLTSAKRKNSSLSITDSQILENENRLRSCDKKIEASNKKIYDIEDINNRINILSKEQNKLIAIKKHFEHKRFKANDDNEASSYNKNNSFLLPLIFLLLSFISFLLADVSLLYIAAGVISAVTALGFSFVSYKNYILKNEYKQSYLEYEKELDNVKNELNITADDIKAFTKFNIDDIIKKNEAELNTLNFDLSMYRRVEAELSELSAERKDILGEINRLKAKRDEYLEKAEIIKLALEILDSAFTEVKDDVFPDVCRKTLDIYSYITDSKCELISSDEGFGISYVDSGFVRDAAHLSKGSIDIMYFSLRMAIVDSISAGKEHIPIFMDDIFANCDDNRTFRLLDLIYKISENNQIFLMTCRSREGEYFKANPNVKIFNTVKG